MEYLKAPGSLLDLLIPILGVVDSRLLARTLPRQATSAFLGISKGTALVSPPQKPEPGIETGIPGKNHPGFNPVWSLHGQQIFTEG